MKAKKLTPFLLSLLILGAACEHGVSSFEGRIGTAIMRKCNPVVSCTIRLGKVTPFEWDRMVYFDHDVSLNTRMKFAGKDVNLNELRRQIVFFRNDAIVHNELLATDVERPIKDELAFEVGEKHWITCNSEAEFTVTRDSFGTGVKFFRLVPTSHDTCR